MKILHLCLSCFYIDNYNYQENVLPKINKEQGHDIEIIASTEIFIENMKLGYTKPSTYINREGIKVKRVSYSKLLPRFIMKKLRSYKGVYKLIEEFKPDVILFHGAAAYEIINVAKYIKRNPNVKLYVDSHEDKNNSGTNWLSLNLLHRVFYKLCLKKAIPYIRKLFYLSYETKDFLIKEYKVSEDILEFYPLGGVIFTEAERREKRRKIRQELQLCDNDILLVHSGKMGKLKRTNDILIALSRIKEDNIKLVIIGEFDSDVAETVAPLIESDSRVRHLGWKLSSDLLNLLCASDLYVQPGSQSATMQNAICCGSPVALYPHKSYEPFVKNNGYFVKSIDDMVSVFNDIVENNGKIDEMRVNSLKLAEELLDYKKLAARLYE